jgi:D-alanine--D-alanine ligase
MRIAVLRGGPCERYDLSLAYGADVIKVLRDKHEVEDIYIDRESRWYRGGFEVLPEQAIRHVDRVFNALHGRYGADGGLQRILDRHGVVYSGPSALSAIQMYNKSLCKVVLEHSGIRTPRHVYVKRGDDLAVIAKEAFKKLGGPYIIKPLFGSYSKGVVPVRAHRNLELALLESLKDDDQLLVEELIHGKEVKCTVVTGLRGEDSYALLPLEVEKAPGMLVHYPASNAIKYHVPARFSGKEKKEVMATAIRAHKALNAEQCSMSDMILTTRGPVVLEVNSRPSLADGSVMQRMTDALGIGRRELVEHLIR